MMLTFKSKILAVVALAVACSVAGAGPLTPVLADPAVSGAVAGESRLCSTSLLGCTSFVKIDWIVGFDPGSSLYTYYYQVENYTTSALDLFSVTGSFGFASFAAGSLDAIAFTGAAGELPGGHDASVYGNLGLIPPPPETEVAPIFVPPVFTSLSPSDVTWLWSFPGVIAPGQQSAILFAASPNAPTYGHGNVADSVPPSPWATTALGSDLLPVPTPEPGFYGLIACGMTGLLWMARRRTKKA